MGLRNVLRTEADWTKRTFQNESGCRCIVGAIHALHLSFGQQYCMQRDLEIAIRRNFPERCEITNTSGDGHIAFIDRANTPMFACIAFNDHPDTTFEDVCKVIEEAGV